MFGWFRPTCPVDPETKRWIEERMQWLTDEFGMTRLRSVQVVLPTPEFFPDAYDGSKKDAKRLLRRVCRYMDVEPDRVKIRFYVDQKPSADLGFAHNGPAGVYAGDTIWIEDSMLADPMALVGTMAHELGHVHLLGDGRISETAEDHEPLTDLITVFKGLGIFTANSVVRERQELGYHQMSRLGYLDMDMFGYAFALFAWHRQETKPAWASHLRGDVHNAFKKGFKYLTTTGDSVFVPPGYKQPQQGQT